MMENIKFENNRLFILDQTRLPNEELYKEMKSIEDCFNAIKRLEVRGAPAIGYLPDTHLHFFTQKA